MLAVLLFSPEESLMIAQENKYLGKLEKFPYFVMTIYVVCTH